jgi:hypothetical protein
MLPAEAVEWLRPRLGAFETGAVVELGSGHGTALLLGLLRPRVRLVTVEHDPEWLKKIPGARYIYAPILNDDHWYDFNILRQQLPRARSIKAVIVDGPPKRGRAAILNHLGLFGDAPMLIDDVHRAEEIALTTEIASRRRVMLSIHRCINGRAFATLGWVLP